MIWSIRPKYPMEKYSQEILRQASTHPMGRVSSAGVHIGYRQVSVMPMQVWDTYALVYVLDGKGRFYDAAGRDLPLHAGDLMLFFPRHGYRYRIDPSEPWSEFYMHFQGPVFDLWRQ